MEVVQLIRRYLEGRGIKVCDVVSNDAMLVIFSDHPNPHNYEWPGSDSTNHTESSDPNADQIISIVHHSGRLYVEKMSKGKDMESFILLIPDPKLFDKLRKIML